MRHWIATIVLLSALGFLLFDIFHKPFVTADPQVAEGSWQISVQVPPCSGDLKILPPEREGSVLTLYCDHMPVKEK